MSSVALPTMQVALLGPLRVSREGAAVDLPSSRKVRALIAYLAMAPRPIGRSHLCEIFWDEPSDPRGELRWCLSKVRGVIDDSSRRRLQTTADMVSLDLSDCALDVTEVDSATRTGVGKLDAAKLESLSKLFAGDFLEGLELDRNPAFTLWLNGQRHRFRACHTAVLEHLAALSPADDEAKYAHLNRWLQLAPFDRRAHEAMLGSLGQQGRVREAEEHLAATAALFESEGLDFAPIRAAWGADRPAPTAASASLIELPASMREERPAATARASVAVMPFADVSIQEGVRGGTADGLTHDIITRLARLRNPFVIAQGTVFALDERKVSPEQAARTLNVDYLVSGSLQQRKSRIMLTAELSETRTARILWSEMFDFQPDGTLEVLDEIGHRIVASIAGEIEINERNRALLKPPASLNAWEAYHRGLWHMYRFNRIDNDRAMHYFQMAVRLDPTFGRAYTGLSFTHFQNAFLLRTTDRQTEIRRAFETASQSLLIDNLDPAAHWAMGRALWLRGDTEQSLSELGSAVELSPNFALAHYTLGFVHCQTGDPNAAINSAEYSQKLSPFDPLLFAMLAVRALAHVRMGQFDVAADWAVKATRRPNAHAHILSIAAHCLAAADRTDEAIQLKNKIHETLPNYGIRDFLDAFQLSPEVEEVFRKSATKMGIG